MRSPGANNPFKPRPVHATWRQTSMWVCAWLVLCLLSAEAGAAARAFLDRDSIMLGETVTLNIEVDGIGSGEPDLSALASNFRVLGSSSNTQVSLVNGQQSARTLWGVVLEPLQEGVLGIPAMEVRGERTAPLTLTVRKQAANAAAQGDVFVEVESSSRAPYVQQQVVYSIRLFYAVTLLDGQLDDPQAEAAEIRRIGSDATFQSERNGRRYNVIERHYAITPQRSGNLSLPAPRFRGRALSDAGRGRMFDPGRAVSAQGEALQLEVRPAPATAASPWLPAQSLQYTAQLSAASSPARVGEPITVTLRVQAQGLAAEQLPELVLPDIPDAEVYPDQETAQTRDNAGWVLGERVRRFAVVPKRPGVLQIPALQMAWWDVVADKAAIANIDPQQMTILDADGQTASTPAEHDVPADGHANPDPVGPEGSLSASIWPWLSGVFAVLWLATLGWAWRLRKQPTMTQASPSPSTQRMALPTLDMALRQGDLAAIASALRFAARQATGQRFASLQEVAACLREPAQRDAVCQLERHLYAADGQGTATLAELRDTLRKVFRSGLDWGLPSSAASTSLLPPLYPERD